MHIQIINGPNLNLLGTRETHLYGHRTWNDYFLELTEQFPQHKLSHFQSNHQGQIIDQLHNTNADAIVINPAAYSHTSIAIADAIKAIQKPTIEVHISNIYAREPYRNNSLISPVVNASLSGFGLYGYNLAIHYLFTFQSANPPT